MSLQAFIECPREHGRGRGTLAQLRNLEELHRGDKPTLSLERKESGGDEMRVLTRQNTTLWARNHKQLNVKQGREMSKIQGWAWLGRVLHGMLRSQYFTHKEAKLARHTEKEKWAKCEEHTRFLA